MFAFVTLINELIFLHYSNKWRFVVFCFFFKKKYNLDASKGFSVGVVSIFISFIITSIFGIISCIYTDNFYIWILGMSFVLIFSPIVFNFFNKIFQKYSFKKAGLLYRMKSFINTIFLHSNGLMIDRSAIFVNILINVLYFTLSFVSYQWLKIILHVNLPLTSIFLILLISRISSLVRLLPGNLGLEELYMASIFEIIGKAPGIGIVFSLILRATTIMVFVPFGIIHFVINLKHIKLLDFKEALRKK